MRACMCVDIVLLARSRVAACDAIRVYVEVVSSLGLAVSFVKVKFIVVGTTVSDEDKCPLAVGYDFIEWVEQFPYLGSLISDDGRFDAEVERRMQMALKLLVLYDMLFLKISTCLLRLSGL